MTDPCPLFRPLQFSQGVRLHSCLNQVGFWSNTWRQSSKVVLAGSAHISIKAMITCIGCDVAKHHEASTAALCRMEHLYKGPLAQCTISHHKACANVAGL